MNFNKKGLFTLLIATLCSHFLMAQTIEYTMPAEISEHEGTWLQWPHNNLYGPYYRDDLEATWVEMTRALVGGEKVHIIAYDDSEYNYILQTLTNEEVPLDNIDFYIQPTNDCWVRDNGPIFVMDEEENLALLDFGFNGWGNDTPAELCDDVPAAIANEIDLPIVDLNALVIEGGAFEVDGKGTFLATKSSILKDDRNPNLTQTEVEDYLTTYLGITNFVWLEGISGLEITDMHIDGFARIHDEHTIVSMDSSALIYWEVPPADISTLFNATNVEGVPFNFVNLPLTQNNVTTTWDENLGFKGSYVNYYVGNDAVLVPTYNDANDNDAIAILETVYPNRTVTGIDVRNLYYGGGMIHCVTQQQPFSDNMVGTADLKTDLFDLVQNSPNPFKETTAIGFSLQKEADVRLEIFDLTGKKVLTVTDDFLKKGNYSYTVDGQSLKSGTYIYSLMIDNQFAKSRKMMVVQ